MLVLHLVSHLHWIIWEAVPSASLIQVSHLGVGYGEGSMERGTGFASTQKLLLAHLFNVSKGYTVWDK